MNLPKLGSKWEPKVQNAPATLPPNVVTVVSNSMSVCGEVVNGVLFRVDHCGFFKLVSYEEFLETYREVGTKQTKSQGLDKLASKLAELMT